LSALGTEIAKSEVRLPQGPIRLVGEYDIELHLHSDLSVVVKVAVVPE
jgi:large subunit ribosomal protein L9